MLGETSSERVELQSSRRAWFRSFYFWRNFGVALILVSPLLVRMWCLSKVPAIPTPFDVDELCQVQIESGEDAFDYYREATRLKEVVNDQYRSSGKTFQPEDYDAVMKSGWMAASTGLKEWLLDNSEARKEWLRGTECADGMYISPHTVDTTTVLPVVQEMREFARMARCDALQLESVGQPYAAADQLIAILQSSRHVRRGGCPIQNLVGIAIYSSAMEGFLQWSDNSKLTAAELQQVLERVRNVNRKMEPPSTALKVEYLLVKNTVANGNWVPTSELKKTYFKGWTADSPYVTRGLMGLYWVFGEPEIAQRTAAQILANQLQEIDKPLSERSPMAQTPSVLLFEPRGKLEMNHLSPAAIERAYQRSFVARHLLPGFKQLDTANCRGRTRQIGLEIALAAQIHFREHGEFPKDTASFVPRFFEVWPDDPMLPHSEGQMQYQRESPTSARIRSYGSWGVDAHLHPRTQEPHVETPPTAEVIGEN